MLFWYLHNNWFHDPTVSALLGLTASGAPGSYTVSGLLGPSVSGFMGLTMSGFHGSKSNRNVSSASSHTARVVWNLEHSL